MLNATKQYLRKTLMKVSTWGEREDKETHHFQLLLASPLCHAYYTRVLYGDEPIVVSSSGHIVDSGAIMRLILAIQTIEYR